MKKHEGRKEFRTAYGPKVRVSLEFDAKADGAAKQSFKNECDINRIMARFQTHGVLDWTSERQAIFADVSSYDFMEAMQTVARANAMFADLPSSVRKRFSNDPAEFLEFASNPENLPDMVKMGLAVKRPEEPAVAPVAGGKGQEPVVGPAKPLEAPTAPAKPV